MEKGDEFNEIILRAGRETALKPKSRVKKDWFELSRDTMHQPLCESKYKILAKVKAVPDAIKPLWESKLKEKKANPLPSAL